MRERTGDINLLNINIQFMKSRKYYAIYSMYLLKTRSALTSVKSSLFVAKNQPLNTVHISLTKTVS